MIEGLYEFAKKWSLTGSVWLYSDPHFGDEELTVGIKGRPSAEEQVKLINSKVGKKDSLIILGDLGDIEYVKKLRGYKVLITGNHDVGVSVYRDYFDEVYGGPLMISPKIILSHEPLDIDWAFNFYGHLHDLKKQKEGSFCVCSDVINYEPVNLKNFIKSGILKDIKSIHRTTIDKATERKAARNKHE